MDDSSQSVVLVETVAVATLRAAEAGWVVTGAALMLFDVWLVRNGRAPLTAAARAHPLISTVLMAGLGLHFLDRLGRFDPFRLVGRGFL